MVEQEKWYRQRWIALGFLCFSLLVISLDTTAMNLALPSISRDLNSSASGLQWIVDAYILVFASLLLTMGSIGDRFGRKRILQVGLLGFGLFSLGGALSTSTGMLIGMRAAMGLAGAAMMPSTLSILTATFRNPKERPQAIALWAATFALGLGIGPLVGGWLIEHFDWSSVFYINIPIVAIGLIGGYFFVHDSRDEHAAEDRHPGISAVHFRSLRSGVRHHRRRRRRLDGSERSLPLSGLRWFFWARLPSGNGVPPTPCCPWVSSGTCPSPGPTWP